MLEIISTLKVIGRFEIMNSNDHENLPRNEVLDPIQLVTYRNKLSLFFHLRTCLYMTISGNIAFPN